MVVVGIMKHRWTCPEKRQGLTGVERVSEVIDIPWPAKVNLSQSVNCLAAKLTTGGGAKSFDVTGVSAGAFTIDSFPVGTLLRDGRPICMRALDLAQERRRSPSKCLLSVKPQHRK